MPIDRTKLAYFGQLLLMIAAPIFIFLSLTSLAEYRSQQEREWLLAKERYNALLDRARVAEFQASSDGVVWSLPQSPTDSRQETELALQQYIGELAQNADLTLSLFAAAPVADFQGYRRAGMRFEGTGTYEGFLRLLAGLNEADSIEVATGSLRIRHDPRRDGSGITFQFVVWQFLGGEN